MSAIGTETLLSRLSWRYATKQFDPARKALEEVLLLAPSSFRLPPSRFYLITDSRTPRKRWCPFPRQRQLADASHAVVFAVKHPLLPEDVRRHIERTAQIRSGSVEELAGFEKVVKDFLENPPDSLDIHQVVVVPAS